MKTIRPLPCTARQIDRTQMPHSSEFYKSCSPIKVALPNVRSAACRRDRVLKLNEFTAEHRIQHVITIPAQMIPIVE